jgi:hypothetical protein
MKFGLHKRNEKEEQNLSYNLKFNKGSCSLDLSPKNMHKRKLRTQEIK